MAQAVSAHILESARQQGLAAGSAFLPEAPDSVHAGSVNGPIQVGAASLQMEFPPGTQLGGYLALEPQLSQDGGCISVGAIALSSGGQPVVALGIDAATVSEVLFTRISQLLPGVALVTTASHCHLGPGGLGSSEIERLFLGPYQEQVVQRLVDGWLSCAQLALQRLQLGSICFGSIRAPHLVTNRTEPGAPIDDTVDIICFRSSADQLLARLVSFAAHPTLSQNRQQLGGDYPAAMRQALQDKGEHTPILFAAGATGSAAANGVPFGNRVAAFGAELAKLVRHSEQPQQEQCGVVAHRRLLLDMPPAVVPDSVFGVLREAFERQPIPSKQPFDLIRIGQLILAVFPGEYSAERTGLLRQHFQGRGLQLAVLAHNGAYGGYYMPSSRYGHPGPESYLEVYGPGAAEIFAQALVGVAEALT